MKSAANQLLAEDAVHLQIGARAHLLTTSTGAGIVSGRNIQWQVECTFQLQLSFLPLPIIAHYWPI